MVAAEVQLSQSLRVSALNCYILRIAARPKFPRFQQVGDVGRIDRHGEWQALSIGDRDAGLVGEPADALNRRAGSHGLSPVLQTRIGGGSKLPRRGDPIVVEKVANLVEGREQGLRPGSAHLAFSSRSRSRLIADGEVEETNAGGTPALPGEVSTFAAKDSGWNSDN